MGLFFFVFIAITVEEAADGPDDTFEEATAFLFCCHTFAIDASGRLWTAEEAAAFGDNGLRGSTVSHVDVAPNVDLASADNFWVEWNLIWVDWATDIDRVLTDDSWALLELSGRVIKIMLQLHEVLEILIKHYFLFFLYVKNYYKYLF